MRYEPPSGTTSYRGPPVSNQTRDKFVLDSNIGYAKSSFIQSQTYMSGPTSQKPYNTRLTDRVELEGVNKNLASMKRKEFIPAKAIKSANPSGKEALYDIRNRPFNEQPTLGNYLPETLKDRNREKIWSSNTWSKNLDMMRSPGQNMSDVYNAQLLTTDTNIPNALGLPPVDDRLRVSQESYQRPFKSEGDKVLDGVRLRNSPAKIERERRQREADVRLKREAVAQLGRYDLTANKFSEINECDVRREVIVDAPIREEFGAGSMRHRQEEKHRANTISGANQKKKLDEEYIHRMELSPNSDYYKDSPGVRKKMYNRGDFVQLVKKGEVYDVFPDDPTSHTAPILVEADAISKKPIRTFATADNKALYLMQKRDADDVYTMDGHKYDKDMIMLEIPYHDMNPIFRKRVQDAMGGTRRNNDGLLDLSYEDLVNLSQYIQHNEDQTVRLKNHKLFNVVRDYEWNNDLNNGFKDKAFFVHPDVIREDREILRQKLRNKDRGRQIANDNYVVNDSGNMKLDYTHDTDVAPIDQTKSKQKLTNRTAARNEPFRSQWGFENTMPGTSYIQYG